MNEWYINTLKRIFGEKRALDAYLILGRLRWIAAAILLVALGTAVILLIPDREKQLTHVSYQSFPPAKVTLLDSDARFGIIVELNLPDGTPLRLVTTEAKVATTVDDLACIETLRSDDDGQLHYRLVALPNCAN